MDPVLITTTALSLFQLALKLRAEMQRTGEWTPEQEAEYRRMTEASFASDAWKPSGRKKAKKRLL